MTIDTKYLIVGGGMTGGAAAKGIREHDADGSITLYFQSESPGKDKESNWLPAPQGDFLPMLRMYWPKQKDPSLLDGTWKPPQIVKVN